ncbi:MAG: leucyl-tRNA synthetase [Parcubacteria group bacterium LiPW_30]|nr:MAG: leucyl-tRNA synthetase [Parcubacteria group bacterium LiPW_30]
MEQYDHRKIEKKWQKVWEEENTFATDEDLSKPKSYILDMFPYPSGEGLHTGHVKVYTASDIYARYKRMNGFRVLHPTGWDAFGLPAERFAIKHKIHPRVAVDNNVATFKRQMKSVGFSYDWEREIDTTDPKFYKWTQWMFLKMYEKGLAYESYQPIVWCPTCQTGLSNEDLEGNACEICGTVAEKKLMRQWVIKITEYADRLVEDLDILKDWPESFKEAERNWIGKSEGSEIDFKIDGMDKKFTVFTTRADTLFGATYTVLSPEHKLVAELKSNITNWDEVLQYQKIAGEKTEIERTSEGKEKTGVKLEGIFAINPANQDKLPVFIADYVLVHYGTGAIMAVPAHDDRDYEFAKKFNLPIKVVIEPVTGEVKENEEKRKSIVAIVRDPKNGKILSLNWGEKFGGQLFIGGGIEDGENAESTAIREIKEETGYSEIRLVGTSETIHHHYFAHSKGVARNIDAIGLHFELIGNKQELTSQDESERGKFKVEWITEEEAEKKVSDPLHQYVFQKFIKNKVYTGNGILTESPDFSGLSSEEAKIKITKFVGGKMKTTYKLRDWVFSRQRYWGEPIPIIHCESCGVVPVPEKDLPVVLPDVKAYEPTGTGESPLADIPEWVNTKCPKCGGNAKRETNTMPQWAGSSWYYLRFIDPKNDKALVDEKKEKNWSPVDVYVGGAEHATRHLIYARFWHKFLYDLGIVSTKEPFMRLESVGLILAGGGVKMSKRLGNIVNPDEIVELYGADTLRIYEMFMGPFGQASAWDTKSIIGPRRFLERVWKLQEKISSDENYTESDNTIMVLNQTIKKVGEDVEEFKFNTAISQMMILVSTLESEENISHKSFNELLLLLSPFAPHFAEELWEIVGNEKSMNKAVWPIYDESKLTGGKVVIAVQINGKLRETLEFLSNVSEDEIKEAVMNSPRVKSWILDKKIKKTIYIKGRMFSIVLE